MFVTSYTQIGNVGSPYASPDGTQGPKEFYPSFEDVSGSRPDLVGAPKTFADTAKQSSEFITSVQNGVKAVQAAISSAKNFVNGRTGGLPPPRTRHYPAITDPDKLGQLLRDIRAYNGNVITRAALQL